MESTALAGQTETTCHEEKGESWIFFHASTSSSHTCFLTGSVLTEMHPFSNFLTIFILSFRSDFELQSHYNVHFQTNTLGSCMNLIILRAIGVTYWLSTEPSIKKQVHPVEGIGISPWPVDGLNSVQRRRKQVQVKQLYNEEPQTTSVRVAISWSSRQAEFSSSCSHSSSSSRSWGQDAVVRGCTRQRAWALRTPVEQPSRMNKKCCYGQRNLGSISGSLFRL